MRGKRLAIAFAVVMLSAVAASRAAAASVLFNAPVANCSGTPRVCYSGGAGYPLAWGWGSFLIGFQVNTDSWLEELELWGQAGASTLWNAEQLCSICPAIPHQQIAALTFASYTSTFYAVGEPQSGFIPIYDHSGTLATPIFLPAGTYYLGVTGLVLPGSGLLFTQGSLLFPGAAIQVRGETVVPSEVPEPSSILLLASGLVGALRRVKRS